MEEKMATEDREIIWSHEGGLGLFVEPTSESLPQKDRRFGSFHDYEELWFSSTHRPAYEEN